MLHLLLCPPIYFGVEDVINHAVVTKLAGRGSVESTDVVTDVGLFLHLLVLCLRQDQTRAPDGLLDWADNQETPTC